MERKCTTKVNIPFFMHDLGQEELDSIHRVYQGPILTAGETVSEFEQKFAAYLGCQHVIAVNSCTAGLHLSLLGLGIGAGDEVITTPMTFIATLQAICYAGAKPVLVDVEPDTGNIDVTQIERAITKRTKAIMPVHLYGLMADMRGLREIADRHGLKIIEDAAHCVEGVRDGVRPAQLGTTASFSFFATKNMTCGEGGAIATNDSELAARLKLLRSHGMTKTSSDRFKEGYKHWDVSMLGWKCNMGNIEAAMLLPQLKRVGKNLERRQRLADLYMTGLRALQPMIRWPESRANVTHSRHLFTLWTSAEKRDFVIAGLQAAGIGCAVNYRSVHLLDWFRQHLGHREGDFPHCERIGRETLTLPLYPIMPEDHVHQVVDRLTELVRA